MSWTGGTASCWASLVGFQFLDTRVLGVPWPGFRNFPELNLRFYVSYGGQRGVCFVREFVPQWLVATVARVIYNEPYRSARMSMNVDESAGRVSAEYRIDWSGRTHVLRATGDTPAVPIAAGSAEEFFLNQSWGFGTDRRGRCIRYEVTHPLWATHPVRDFTIDIDWTAIYGAEWKIMTGATPASVFLVEGSEVAVNPLDVTRKPG